MASRKTGEYAIMVSRYGELRPRIQHGVIVHDVSVGLGKKASRQLSEVLDIAKELKVGIDYQEEGAEHTWTASDFATKWVQRMSFTVVKFRAMTVLAGLHQLPSIRSAERFPFKALPIQCKKLFISCLRFFQRKGSLFKALSLQCKKLFISCL